MIYTSYFARLRLMPDSFYPVAICQFPPKWYDGPVYKGLAPTKSIFFEYKDHYEENPKYWEKRYTERFQEEVLSHIIDWKALLNHLAALSGIQSDVPVWEDPEHHLVLCCFEKEEEFCHRHLVSEDLKKRGFSCKEAKVEDFTRQKAQSSVIKTTKAICFDTETTGFSPEWDDLLQLSIVDEHCNALLSTYLKPQKKSSWPNAMAINHITPQMVKNAPKPYEVAGIVQKLFNEAEVIVGHNVPFDIRFVEANLGVKVDPDKVFDTLSFFKIDRPGGKHKLIDAVTYYCPEILKDFEQNAHDALADTKATMCVYNAIMERKKSMDSLVNDFYER